MKTREMRAKNGKQNKPDTRKLAVEFNRLKKILENRTAPMSARSKAVDRMRTINRETDPARDVLW